MTLLSKQPHVEHTGPLGSPVTKRACKECGGLGTVLSRDEIAVKSCCPRCGGTGDALAPWPARKAATGSPPKDDNLEPHLPLEAQTPPGGAVARLWGDVQPLSSMTRDISPTPDTPGLPPPLA